MRQNNYYKTIETTSDGKHVLISYSFRTKQVIIYRTKKDFTIPENMDFEGCEKSVENKFWTRISYKEFLDTLNQNEKPVVIDFSESRYFVRTENKPHYKFLECKSDKTVIAHISKTENYKLSFKSDLVISNKCWKEITKTEAFKLLEDLPVVKADTVIPEPKEEILYYDYMTGFKNPALFLSANTKTKQTYIHTRENQKGELASYSYSFEDCEHYVKCGTWKYITKEQAYDKFKTVPDTKLGLQIESSPTPDKKIQLPEINFFILVKKGTLGTLYFKYIDPKNWTWVNNFDECTKFSTTFLHGEKFHQIKENLIDPLLEKDKQKLHWIQMSATKVDETTYEAY